MSNGIVNLHHLGRMGNNLFSYCFARGYCERYGFELHTDPWPGERIFCIDHPRCRGDLERKDENTIILGEGNISYCSYSQRQKCANFYNLEKIRQWLRFRPNVEAALQTLIPSAQTVVAHIRRGDYAGYGYPLVSEASYFAACKEIGVEIRNLMLVSEEYPAIHEDFRKEFLFVPDFFRLAKASILLRANSSFSFWAAAIAQANQKAAVFSPVIEGLEGGVEHACRFIPGNSARIADLGFVERINIPVA